uniref:Membrane protein n=2 Tax=Mizugakiibacter sediminis TaxID=1475481 RepID=A0A0S6YWI1_9GAMM
MTLTGLALACVLALAAALAVTRAPARASLDEGRRLLDTMGWAALLPLVLAALGGVFAATGVGDAIAALTAAAIPVDSRLACVLAYGLGMVLFTAIMGNAFAAFPVLTAGIGLPLLIGRHGANPAALGALGMLTGYCGTLLTPMAANFNIVPAALLQLDDQHGVIRMQVPTALALLAVNLALMYLLVFR